MILDYSSFKLEQTLERYAFTDEMTEIEFESYIENYIFEMNEGKFSEWKESMTQKLSVAVLKAWNMVEKVGEMGIKVIKKIVSMCWSIIKVLGKWCDKNKIVCACVMMFIVMITIGAVATYAAANPTDPNLPELANAALGYMEVLEKTLDATGVQNYDNNFGKNLLIAKSILVEIRNGGEQIDYSFISKQGQEIAYDVMSAVNKIKMNDPDKFNQLVDIGSTITKRFTYIVNGLKTVLGG